MVNVLKMKTIKVKNIIIKKPDITYPDVDTDFGSGKDELVNYLVEKYGQDHVAYVGNRLTYSPKSVIRDLGQVYNIPASETIACTKEYNDAITAKENIKQNKKVAAFFARYPELVDKVDAIVGTVSGLGVHAGGVVVTDRKYPITHYCALQRSSDEGRIATLWTKDELQPIGLVKYDLLGLTTAGQNHKIKEMLGMDPYAPILVEDEEVYRDVVLMNKHRNIFQFETQLGKRLFEDLKPMNFMELANASSILRIIGSEDGRDTYNLYKSYVEEIQMGNTDYWKTRLREEIVNDELYNICVDVLSDSYGVLIYQEQVAELVKKISKGRKTFADGNRARKFLEAHNVKCGRLGSIQGNPEALKKWHTAFMGFLNEFFLPYLKQDGWQSKDKNLQAFLNCKLDNDNNLYTPKYGFIKMLIAATAYLFSKLHAVAYTQNTYDAMWLKHYYPLEFWTGSLIYEQANLEKVTSYILAINRETKIKVLPPNINKSSASFQIEGKSIRYGLRAIMNVGDASNRIVAEREANGKYKSIKDFCSRLNTKSLNKRVMVALLYTCAFAEFGTIPEVHAALVKEGVNLGTLIDDTEKLAMLEAKYLGTAITNVHPLVKAAKQCMPVTDFQNGDKYNVAVHIVEVKNKVTAKKKPYVMFKVQCLNSLEVFNIFDWNNNMMDFKKGAYEIMHISKNNDFFNLVMKKDYEPQKKFNNFRPRTVSATTQKNLKEALKRK